MPIRLPSVSKSQVEVSNWQVGNADFLNELGSWPNKAAEVLSELLKARFSIDFKQGSAVQAFEPVGQVIPISWPVRNITFFLELETEFAQCCAYRAIDRFETPVGLDPELSALEQGILDYLLSKVSQALGESMVVAHSARPIDAAMVAVVCEMKCEDRKSFARIWIPQAFFAVIPETEALERGKAICHLAKTQLVIELGSISISGKEYIDLEIGDILVLEELSLENVQGRCADLPIQLTASVQKNADVQNYSLTLRRVHG
ncbi:MAG: hypothetical protein I8H75_01050 [Myxococcaceae bacterium]|nr:hypothetical protein [Myxococcaceae bacterium]MBH2005928.1 hypothetical protein [Myxococcaceae bacterium]